MNLDHQAPAIILLPIDDERFDTYRNAVFERISAPDDYELLKDSHITIHPGFTTTPHGMETLRLYLESQDINPDVTATALYAYPSVQNPSVISVAVRIDLKSLRENIYHILDSYDHSILKEPAPSHITLLKRRTLTRETLPEDVQSRVQTAVEELPPPSGQLDVGKPRIEWFNPPYDITQAD